MKQFFRVQFWNAGQWNTAGDYPCTDEGWDEAEKKEQELINQGYQYTQTLHCY